MKKKIKKRRVIKKEVNFLKTCYSEVWDYISESKNMIWIVIGIFLFGVVMAGFFPVPSELGVALNKLIEDLILKTQGMNTLELIVFIFQNNTLACLMSLFFGVLFGLFPLISSIANGYIVGYVVKAVVLETSFIELWRLLPHGIFELPAVFIAMGLGLKFGLSIFSEYPGNEFKRRFILSVKVFIFVVLPLLIIAAVIEGLLMGFGI